MPLRNVEGIERIVYRIPVGRGLAPATKTTVGRGLAPAGNQGYAWDL
ncbi:MAG: hypothetical protein IIX86_06970 [Clostridia bacterium]|nr:hypothetical protein [Clostridia bacterium]